MRLSPFVRQNWSSEARAAAGVPPVLAAPVVLLSVATAIARHEAALASIGVALLVASVVIGAISGVLVRSLNVLVGHTTLFSFYSS